MDAILAQVAAWGLGFALLNLLITVDKILRDPDQPKFTKRLVIAGAAILMSYAFVIGGFALGLLFGGGEQALLTG